MNAAAARQKVGALQAPASQSEGKLGELAEVLFTAAPGTLGYAPLSPFLLQLWRRARPGAVREAVPRHREKFLYWYLNKICGYAFPYRWPLARETAEWLNEPRPVAGLNGAQGQPTFITRFMETALREHFPALDLAPRENYDNFLAWFAYEFLPSRKMPWELLPDTLLNYLNEPVEDLETPFSRGMLALERLRTRMSAPEIRMLPSERQHAIAFEMLESLIAAENPRLAPPFVTSYWRAPTSTGRETRFESVERLLKRGAGEKVEEPESDSDTWPETESGAEARDDEGREWGQIGLVSEVRLPEVPPGKAPRLHPATLGILSYRDHRTVCGLSRAGAAVLAGLREMGIETVDLEYNLGRNRPVLEHRKNGRLFANFDRAIHVFNVNPEYLLECLMCNMSRVQAQDYFIGQFAWELPEIGKVHEPALRVIDEIWVESEFLVGVYGRRTPKPVRNVGTVVTQAEPDDTLRRADFGVTERDYVFLTTFDAISSVERKNPAAAIEAFWRAFPRGDEPARLIVKTRNIGRWVTAQDRDHWRRVERLLARDWRIHLLDETLTEPAMSALYCASDCFVSLHRSEGFGFGPAEAMYHGRPVIVTAYSGVCDFCTSETAKLVDYCLVPLRPGDYPFLDRGRTYHWADPDVDMAARHMRELYENRQLGAELGARAQRLIRDRYSLDALAERYRTRFVELGVLTNEDRAAEDGNR